MPANRQNTPRVLSADILPVIPNMANRNHLRLFEEHGRRESKCYDSDEVIENSIVLSRSVLNKLSMNEETSSVAK